MNQGRKSNILTTVAFVVAFSFLLVGYVVGYFALGTIRLTYSDMSAVHVPIAQTRIYRYQWQSCIFYPLAVGESCVSCFDTDVRYDAEWLGR